MAFPIAQENDFIFVGGHPMAGIEFSGFEYSQKTLFKNASMILTPSSDTDIRTMAKLKKLWLSLGFTHVQIATPKEHDRMIAFTSQLAHVVSNAYIKSPSADKHRGFSAGSYKDLSRVAKLNPDMWTELFFMNRDFLVEELDNIIERLNEYRQAIKIGDEEGLWKLLKEGSDRKIAIDD
jgi:prephenate dehydrogenase